uniref:Uncharacterized protein n=1 Tax=Candidatus Kentrum sp. SD TaxID=2126332 RepID=A0A450YUY5_9GAMM|nr:MAG: hypothetical protein BECKSD772F_GA0070984_104825 [Candidatus Kentron sp. SD]VFK45333.1 MAG: hypothetical protein BECKSD772E_GA0070983_105124 [Candidatus Kentron sp. SD]
MVYRASFGPSSSARIESFVESNRAPRDTPIEGESEENLRWYSLVHKFGNIMPLRGNWWHHWGLR